MGLALQLMLARIHVIPTPRHKYSYIQKTGSVYFNSYNNISVINWQVFSKEDIRRVEPLYVLGHKWSKAELKPKCWEKLSDVTQNTAKSLWAACVIDRHDKLYSK
jgi:hypothetical protein